MDERNNELTWAALLAKWTEFAQASVALPRTSVGERWRASVPAVIALQAVTHALGEVGDLPEGERAVGMARAGSAIQKHERELRALWGAEMGAELEALIGDAHLALGAQREG